MEIIRRRPVRIFPYIANLNCRGWLLVVTGIASTTNDSQRVFRRIPCQHSLTLTAVADRNVKFITFPFLQLRCYWIRLNDRFLQPQHFYDICARQFA
jgi:hypothetical protein